jgi:hypothetical protein
MGDWNPLYGTWNNAHELVSDEPVAYFMSYNPVKTLSAEAYKAQIGKEDHTPALRAASTWGGTPVPSFILTMDDFKQRILGMPPPPDGKEHPDIFSGHEGQVKRYLSLMYEAFRIFQIDTVEAQALFLAHGAGETKFSVFTEGQTNHFVDDPSLVEIDMEPRRPLEDRKGPTRYAQEYYVRKHEKDWIDPSDVIWLGGTVPTAPGRPTRTRAPMVVRDFDKTFIGRGSIQITFGNSYVRTLMYMDAARDTANALDAKVLTNAYDKIRADPIEAARTEHTFLFAAAYLHMSGMVRSAPAGFTEAGMSGGHPDAQGGVKATTYTNARDFLMETAQAYGRANAETEGTGD